MKNPKLSHNACYGCTPLHRKYNYIVDWYQCSERRPGKFDDYRRFVDTFQDYTAYGALRQFEDCHYINATVVSVYRHSEVA